MTGSVAVSKDGLQYRFVIPGTSAVALSRSGTVFTSISPRARASESARGSATREATLRCGEPMQLQLWVRIFCLQSRQRARCRAGPRAFCKLRDDGTVPLICPTCQNVFAGIAQGIHASDRRATLHGVVFDILVGELVMNRRSEPQNPHASSV